MSVGRSVERSHFNSLHSMWYTCMFDACAHRITLTTIVANDIKPMRFHRSFYDPSLQVSSTAKRQIVFCWKICIDLNLIYICHLLKNQFSCNWCSFGCCNDFRPTKWKRYTYRVFFFLNPNVFQFYSVSYITLCILYARDYVYSVTLYRFPNAIYAIYKLFHFSPKRSTHLSSWKTK